MKEIKIIYLLLLFGFFYFLFNVVPKMPATAAIKKGTKLILEKDYEKGLELFAKGASSKRIKAFTKIRYAFCELKFGDIKKAKKMISLLINSGRLSRADKYEAKSVWSLITFIEGDLEQTEELADELYENYKNTDVYCTLGYIYNVTKSPADAVKFNEEAYDYNSDKAVICDNLGQAYYLNGEYEKAEETYKKGLEKEPQFPEIYYNYALLLSKKGENDEALKLLDTSLKMEFHNLTTIKKQKVEALKKEIQNVC